MPKAGDVAGRRWFGLFNDFTQETSLHGIKTIFDRTSYKARRIVWLLICLAALACVIVVIVLNIVKLTGHPRNVNIDFNYSNNLSLPAILICNQNAFRRSTTLENGLYDTITTAFSGATSANFSDALDPGAEFVTYPETYMEGIGDSYTKYTRIPLTSCKKACVTLQSDTCCSLVYIEATSTCYVTPYDVTPPEITSGPIVKYMPHPGTHVLRRVQCHVQYSAQCDFESGNTCNFLPNSQKTAKWTVTSPSLHSSGTQRVNGPLVDHTTRRPNGSYVQVVAGRAARGLAAVLLSPYLTSRGDTCLRLAAQITAGRLTVRLGAPGQRGLTVLWTAGQSGPESRGLWVPMTLRLPRGYYRVYLTAEADSGSDINIAMDDVIIDKCNFNAPSCKTSVVGFGYQGDHNVTLSGRTCQPWRNLTYTPPTWRIPTGDMSGWGSACRNPDGNPGGPWCYTDWEAGRAEYCDVPLCACSNTQYACATGNCIAAELHCDGVPHCGDGSDEVGCHVLTVVQSINCSFENPGSCGYMMTSSDYQVTQELRSVDGVGFALIDMDTLPVGAVITLTGPPTAVTPNSCLQVQLRTREVSVSVVLTNGTSQYYLGTIPGPRIAYWTTYLFPVNTPPGDYNLQLQATILNTTTIRHVHLELDSILLETQACSQNETQVDSVSCVFNQESMCGYTSLNNTVQPTSHVTVSDQYLSLPMTNLVKEQTVVLNSPQMALTPDSCLDMTISVTGVSVQVYVVWQGNDNTTGGGIWRVSIYNLTNINGSTGWMDAQSSLQVPMLFNYTTAAPPTTAQMQTGLTNDTLVPTVYNTTASPPAPTPAQMQTGLTNDTLVPMQYTSTNTTAPSVTTTTSPPAPTTVVQQLGFPLLTATTPGFIQIVVTAQNISFGGERFLNMRHLLIQNSSCFIPGDMVSSTQHAATTSTMLNGTTYMGTADPTNVTDFPSPSTVAPIVTSPSTVAPSSPSLNIYSTSVPYLEPPIVVYRYATVDPALCPGCSQRLVGGAGQGSKYTGCAASVTCGFEAGCDCQYMFSTSLTALSWGLLSHANLSLNLGTYAGLVGNASDPRYASLMSPIVNLTQPGCLYMDYMVQYSSLEVWARGPGVAERVLLIPEGGGQLAEWHATWMLLPPGEYRLYYIGRSVSSHDAYLGVDNIRLEQTACGMSNTSYVNASVECTFDNIEMCGYQDVTSLPTGTIWFRNNEGGHTTPGGFFMMAQTPQRLKTNRRLLSPPFNVTHTEGACVSFYYQLTVTNRLIDASFAVFLLDGGAQVTPGQNHNGSSQVVWAVHRLNDVTWNYATLHVPLGYFRLLFEVNGDKVTAALDDVNVTMGACQNISCAVSCGAGSAAGALSCISAKSLCDGIPHCMLLPESKVTCNDTELSATPGSTSAAAPSSPLVPDPGDTTQTQLQYAAYLSDVMNATDLLQGSLEDFYLQNGHQASDFIYRCTWQGKDCRHSFRPMFTDYGLCHVMNDDDALRVARSGVFEGLNVALNIEQYDYMAGPQSQAGVRLFLYSPDNVPRVQDLGFAVGPGTHTYIGVTRTDIVNLEFPWGTCGEQELPLYENYTYSKCLINHATERLNSTCGCRDVYMPHNQAGPVLCTPKEYINCIIPDRYFSKTSFTPKSCKKSCEMTFYDPTLSYTALSTTSVSRLLANNKQRLQKQLADRVDISHHGDASSYVNDLQMVLRLNNIYNDLLASVQEFTSSSVNSTANRFLRATNVLESLFKGDLDTTFGLFRTHSQLGYVYAILYEKPQKILKASMEDLSLISYRFSVVYQYIGLGWTLQNNVTRLSSEGLYVIDNILSLYNFSQQMMKGGNTVLDTVLAYDKMGEMRYTSIDPNVLKTYIPSTIFDTACAQAMQAQYDLVVKLRDDIQYIANNYGTLGIQALQNVNVTFQAALQDFMKQVPQAVSCNNAYPSSIASDLIWEAGLNVDAQLSKRGITVAAIEHMYNFTEQSQSMKNFAERAESAYIGYINHDLSAMEFLKTFNENSLGEQADALLMLKAFVDKLHTTVTGPITDTLSTIETIVVDGYVSALEKVSKLEPYLSAHYFYDIVKDMQLWRHPTANLIEPSRYNTIGGEFWQVWSRDQSIGQFVESGAAKKNVMLNLKGYLEPLNSALSDFKRQLIDLENNLNSALLDAKSRQQTFEQIRLINDNFILKNFLTFDIYFKELEYQIITQQKAYDIASFFTDLGGIMGLCIGASVISIVEIFDFVIYNAILKCIGRKGGKNRLRLGDKNGIPLQDTPSTA